ncbi:hypothetical protein N7462_010609 [Penicillium macrosclerotiorum]|uniref:uncharacterized protein n=1 Tax=Penicillium macrosclerotiorum TaxID=303699 RepID=UPI00254859E1|nr:uncharacterized protein N7462_010609 [Penicillium macrosclerotiorum]KAJ5669539.1 hypothetical protein N7462_010609 [Penicillium macrosclerotiorum]
MDSSLLLEKLPAEILDQIIGAIRNKQDLRSMRKTCRAINNLAQRWRYHDTYIDMEGFLRRLKYNDLKRFREHLKENGHLIREVYVRGERIAPACGMLNTFNVAPFLEKLPNMRKLEISGGCGSESIADTIQEYIMTRSDKKDHMYTVLERASLLTPPRERALQSLRSLTLNLIVGLSSDSGSDWHLDEIGFVFLIENLEDLTLSRVNLGPSDPEIPLEEPLNLEQFRGRTNLRRLTITESHINLECLEKVLTFPRALTHLKLDHRKPILSDWEDEQLEDWEKKPYTPDDLHRAIGQQRFSLASLEIKGWDLGYLTKLESHLSDFPTLWEYIGWKEAPLGELAEFPFLGEYSGWKQEPPEFKPDRRVRGQQLGIKQKQYRGGKFYGSI